jgi:hypothetical protein
MRLFWERFSIHMGDAVRTNFFVCGKLAEHVAALVAASQMQVRWKAQAALNPIP